LPALGVGAEQRVDIAVDDGDAVEAEVEPAD